MVKPAAGGGPPISNMSGRRSARIVATRLMPTAVPRAAFAPLLAAPHCVNRRRQCNVAGQDVKACELVTAVAGLHVRYTRARQSSRNLSCCHPRRCDAVWALMVKPRLGVARSRPMSLTAARR